MATFTWGVLCRRAIVDQGNGPLSLIDIIEALAAPRFPINAPLIIATSSWQRSENDQGSIEIRARVEAPDGTTLTSDSVTPTLEPTHKRARINIGLAGYELPGPGRYFVVLEQRAGDQWREGWRLPFDIELVAEPTGEAPARRGGKAVAATKTRGRARH